MAIRVPADDAPSDAPPVDEQVVLEECAVVRWRGYTRSTFVACLEDGTPVAESRSFKWRDDTPPHDGAAAEALSELERELERLGWAHTGDGDEWFAVRYGRWVAAPEHLAEEIAPVEEALAPVAARPLPPPLPVYMVPEPAPAPQPVPVAEREPVLEAAAPAAPTARHRHRVVPLVSVLGIATAVGLGAYIAKGSHAKPTQTVQLVSVASKTHAAPTRKTAVAAPAQTVAPAPMHLVIANVGHASWLEVRRGSATGRVLYSGILDAGGTIRYAGKTLWVRFAGASNFHVAVDGRSVQLQGTLERVFSAKR